MGEPQFPSIPPGPAELPPESPGEPRDPVMPPVPMEDPARPTPPLVDPEPAIDPRELPPGPREPPAEEISGVFAWSDEDVLPVGRIIDDRYVIQGSLGTGGCGTVYAADDLQRKRRVALKVPHPELDAHLELSYRFRREIRVASLVKHKNVLAVYGSGTLDDGRPYMAMELVRGESVAQRMLRGRMSVEEALEVALQTLEGVAAVARKHVVHRDIKPSNIMISGLEDVRQGSPRSLQAKLIDFGTAKVIGDTRSSDDRVTRSRSLIGTPEYMAPEQFDGLPIDERTDIYGCAAVFYEMLTGKPPMCTKEREVDHPGGWLSEKRSVRLSCPECPPAVDRVILKALSASPARRYASAHAMHTALREAYADTAPSPWRELLRSVFAWPGLASAELRR